MTQILIADDHPLFRLALTQAPRAIAPDATLIEADSLAAARTQNPAVIRRALALAAVG